MVIRRCVVPLLIASGVLVGVLGARTALLTTAEDFRSSATEAPPVIEDPLERLAEALRAPTLSVSTEAPTATAAFRQLHEQLRQQFPRVFAALQVEVVNDFSLLMTWPGADRAAAPALLIAHLDVVPVEPGTEALWTYPPFAGVIADGFVWGRGTLDDKASVLAQLEAAESLLAVSWQPPRDVIFAFGHDEEIGGQQGAAAMAALLAERGVMAEFVLDEGGAVTEGIVPGIDRPVATLMTGEKGYASFRLSARAEGGHSSTPPRETAVGRLARAVARVQDQPLPPRLTAPIIAMLESQAPHLPWTTRMAIANRWLFAPLIKRIFDRTDVTRALVRTTTAPTVIQGGVKDNILPSEAHALINFRLLPGDSAASVLAHLQDMIADDGIQIEAGPFSSPPSRVSATSGAAFRRLAEATTEVFPTAVISTGLVVGATDARHYDAVAAERFNFAPMRITPDDLKRIHGHNERIAVEDYPPMIRFYQSLLQRL